MGKVGIGIIGFGRIGAEHAGWISACSHAAVVGVADGTPARQGMARERGLTVHDTVQSLFADRRVEAVLVATPTSMHFDHASAVLAAGRHLMVEKPMTLDLPHAMRLRDQAALASRILTVFHNRRFDRDYLTVRAAIRSGRLGRPINVESRLGQWASCVGPAAREYRPNWRNEAGFGGGVLYDWGSHFVDQMWRLLWPAKPTRVFAQLRGNVWSTDCDDFARVLIDFDSGAAALVEVNTTTTIAMDRWRVDGSLGSATSPNSPAFDTDVWSELDLLPAPAAGPMAAGHRPTPVRLAAAPRGLTETEIWDRFALAIRGQGLPAIDVRSVLGTMALLDAARQSSTTGCSVDVSQVDWWIEPESE